MADLFPLPDMGVWALAAGAWRSIFSGGAADPFGGSGLGGIAARHNPRTVCVTASKTRRGFEVMVLPHLDAAYNLARWLTHNPDDAEDVVQEAYLRAFRYYAGFDGDDARSRLLTIVRNTCYTWLRNNRDRREVMLLDDDLYHDEDGEGVGCGAGGENPEMLMVQSADRALLNRLIAELPLPFREALVLRELEELSYKEIAEVTAVPIGTVMSRLARARRLLQQAFVAQRRRDR